MTVVEVSKDLTLKLIRGGMQENDTKTLLM